MRWFLSAYALNISKMLRYHLEMCQYREYIDGDVPPSKEIQRKIIGEVH